MPVVLHDDVDLAVIRECGLDQNQRTDFGLGATDENLTGLATRIDRGERTTGAQLADIAGAVIALEHIAVHRGGIDAEGAQFHIRQMENLRATEDATGGG
ncbi:hypothetical protein D3C78_1622460 [compost metagenome]